MHVVIERVVALGAALVESNRPDVLFLQVIERARDVDHPRHRQMLGGSSRSLDDRPGYARRAPIGNDGPVHSGAVGRAQQGPQVVRIFHSVQHQQEDVFAAAFGDQIVDAGKRLPRSECHHSLVRVGAGCAVDLLARNKAHRNSLVPAVVDDALHAGIGAVAADGYVVEAALPRLQRLADRMNAVDYVIHACTLPRPFGRRAAWRPCSRCSRRSCI